MIIQSNVHVVINSLFVSSLWCSFFIAENLYLMNTREFELINYLTNLYRFIALGSQITVDMSDSDIQICPTQITRYVELFNIKQLIHLINLVSVARVTNLYNFIGKVKSKNNYKVVGGQARHEGLEQGVIKLTQSYNKLYIATLILLLKTQTNDFKEFTQASRNTSNSGLLLTHRGYFKGGTLQTKGTN